MDFIGVIGYNLYFLRKLNYWYQKPDDNPDKQVMLDFWWRMFYYGYVIQILFVFKVFTGMRWIFQRTRQNFIPYYRMSMTFNFYTITVAVQYLIAINIQYMNVFYMQLYSVVWYLIESLFLEIHIRYIDSVHIAKNELQKNKNILKSYRDHLRQQKL